MHLQSILPELSFHRKIRKKINNNQNGVVLVTFTLIIRLLICLNYTPDWLQIFILCNVVLEKTSISAPDLSVFFSLVLGFGFIQFNPQLTIKLSISSISPLFQSIKPI
jgi:hypothetical protein